MARQEYLEKELKPQLHKHSVNKRFYFRQDDDTCYKIENHLAYMIENHIEEMDIFFFFL